MSTLKGPGEAQQHDGSALRIAIVHARWNTPIISALIAGARKALLEANVHPSNIVVQTVPGSYELPYAVQRIYAASQVQSSTFGGVSSATDLLSSVSVTDLTATVTGTGGEGVRKGEGSVEGSTEPFDAVIAIGVVIKGETMHDEYIANAVSQGLMRVQLDAGVPVVFGLLTVFTEEQAKIRAGLVEGKGHNHGEDWGRGAVELGVKRKSWAKGKML